MAKQGEVSFDREHCKGCWLCAVFCPQGIIGPAPENNAQGYHPAEITDPAGCTGCAQCARMCPDVVITVKRVEAA